MRCSLRIFLFHVLTVLGALSALLVLSAAVTARDRTFQPPSPSVAEESIVISEILAHADDPYVDSVELFNLSATSVNLSGWLMTDKTDRPQTDWVRIPDGAQIGGGGFYVIAETDENPWLFGLSEGGDSIYLYRPDPQSGALIQVAAVEFGASPVTVSMIRHVDSIDRVHYPFQEGAPTLGAPNCPVLVGPVVIEEIMPDPQANDGEYLVISNISSAPADLFDPEQPTNTWKLIGQNSRGKDNDMFIFPIGLTLAPGERLILSQKEPEAFRSAYNIPASVRILGPLAGGLSKEGERVALVAPQPPEIDAVIYYAIVDEVAYRGQAPWPDVAENGLAMGRIVSNEFANDPANWQAVTPFQSLVASSWRDNLLSSDPTIFAHYSYLPVITLPPYGCW
jgi:hypothetical protein